MDIGSGNSYPSSALSNFSPHPFVLDGIECASMEGFLQSLKFKNPDMQREVCKLVGKAAKFRGAPMDDFEQQIKNIDETFKPDDITLSKEISCVWETSN